MEMFYMDDLSEWANKKEEVLVCMETEYLQHKHYDLYLAALIQGITKYSAVTDTAMFDVHSARQMAVRGLGFTYYRFNKCIECMEEIGLIQKGINGWYIVTPFAAEGKKFVKVKMNEVRECMLRDLSPFEFKVFLIFRNVQGIKKTKGIKGDFLFSAKGMLEECGYSYAEKNRRKFQETLDKLEELCLIEYTHECVYKPNRGLYHALKWAEVRDIGYENPF